MFLNSKEWFSPLNNFYCWNAVVYNSCSGIVNAHYKWKNTSEYSIYLIVSNNILLQTVIFFRYQHSTSPAYYYFVSWSELLLCIFYTHFGPMPQSILIM